ncbi:hypothetical protein [Gaoshiqia sp. Z1-71]|uniref:hypothetical protein n=1 Tax=Gaoshiqia hydrogeniformans TaxID=3290090 RepID=UPI003BF893EE
MNLPNIQYLLFRIALGLMILASSSNIGNCQSKYVTATNGQLAYQPDEKGNIIPDFSRVGYYNGERDIPAIEIVKVISPALFGDSGGIIQHAIDEVATFPVNENGFRGAIFLRKGIYNISGNIEITVSGIVLYGDGDGDGDGEEGTVLVATGKGRRSLVQIKGQGKRQQVGEMVRITDPYVPVGCFSFKVGNPEKFKIGDPVVIFRQGTKDWIHDLEMDAIVERDGTRQWQAQEYDLHFERTIKKIDGETILLDNPVVMSMEEKYGGGYIYKYSFDGRISQIGIENIRLKSEFNSDNDEEHSWIAIEFEKTENGWVRGVTAEHFAYSCVNIGGDSKMITVDHCFNREPKSIVTGGRRYSFNVNGQLNLVKNCEASGGRHDFVTGAKVCGPNVFYNCTAINTHSDIGPHHRWAVGTLYDNVITDGDINVQDRGNWGSGHGWAGATQVVWNCTAKRACVQSPWVSATNYCIGFQGEKYSGRLPERPDGEWDRHNEINTFPKSLFQSQLTQQRTLSDLNSSYTPSVNDRPDRLE